MGAVRPEVLYKQMSEPDPCGNRFRGIDGHLTPGGAHLHLLELELGLLSLLHAPTTLPPTGLYTRSCCPLRGHTCATARATPAPTLRRHTSEPCPERSF